MNKTIYYLKRVFGIYSRSNTTFKKMILFLLLLLILVLFSLFNIPPLSSFGLIIISIYVMIFAFISPEWSPDIGKIILTLGLVFLIIVMVFTWLSGGNIPYTNMKADNNTIIALFTIILAIATIINVITYKQSIGLSRLTELDFSLNKILCVEIENLGNYPARGIKLTTQIKDKDISEGRIKRKIIDSFSSPEFDKHYLSSKSRYAERLRDYLEKRFNLNYDVVKEQHTSNKKKKFRIMLTLNYHSDTFFKNPIPIIKEYEVEVDSNGMTKKEVKPSNNPDF